MTIMNSEVYDALVSAGADEAKVRAAAKSAARHDSDIARIRASLLTLKLMADVTFVLTTGLAWRAFQ